MYTCPECGNTLREPGPCPICDAVTTDFTRPRHLCPQCREALKMQNWEGHATYCCSTCQGTFFPGSSLERVLDKLRRETSEADAHQILEELRARNEKRQPPRARGCPVCDMMLDRVIYATVSGIYIEVCKTHGVWVDEPTFLELSDFVSAVGNAVREDLESLRSPLGSKQRGNQDLPVPDPDPLGPSPSNPASKKKGKQTIVLDESLWESGTEPE